MNKFRIIIACILFCACSQEIPTDPEKTTAAESNPTTESFSANTKIIKMETVPWPPFFSDDLPGGGPLVEITKEAFKRSGHQLEINFIPWKRAKILASKGQSHALFGCYYKKEREERFRYSSPLTRVKIYLFKKGSRSIKFRTLADLKPYKIGIIRGFNISKEFDSAAFLNKIEVDRVPQLIRMLENNRIQLAAEAELNFLAEYKKLYPNKSIDLERIEPPLSKNGIYICFSRRVPGIDKLVEIFDRELKGMRQDGSFRRIMAAHGVAE